LPALATQLELLRDRHGGLSRIKTFDGAGASYVLDFRFQARVDRPSRLFRTASSSLGFMDSGFEIRTLFRDSAQTFRDRHSSGGARLSGLERKGTQEKCNWA
jgi:hypothetical protein